MAKTKKEELIEGVDAPSVDPVVTEDATEVVTIETVAKSLLDEAEAEIERLNLTLSQSNERIEELKKEISETGKFINHLNEALNDANAKIEALQGGPVVIAEKTEPLSFEFEGEKYLMQKESQQK